MINVTIETNIDRAALEDDLHQTINYEIIYRICSDIMEQPSKLLETVAFRIAHEIKKSFPKVKNIQVVLYKMKPELGGPVHSAQVVYKLK